MAQKLAHIRKQNSVDTLLKILSVNQMDIY